MSLLIVRYRDGNGVRWAKLTGAPPAHRTDMVEIAPIDTDAQTTADLIVALAGDSVPADYGKAVQISAADLLSPVTTDARILCQGLNYGAHAAEAGHHVRKQNLFFMKASSTLSGPYSDIVRPQEVQLLDYEVEIGVVLRTDLLGATQVTDANIGDYVAGVVLCDDVSARDVMFGASFLQWFQGKSFRTFCPAGPVLCLLEPGEVAETLASLEIKLWLNGELRQSAASAQLIYKPAETLTQLSGFMDMKRGDLLLTGTPGGVIAQGTPKVLDILKSQLMDDEARRTALCEEFQAKATFLQPGDVVTANLNDVRLGRDLGGQSNTIIGT